jgi:hypothetical protein
LLTVRSWRWAAAIPWISKIAAIEIISCQDRRRVVNVLIMIKP